jgi:hypothetical protein
VGAKLKSYLNQEVLTEHARLIARGVRAFALAGDCPADKLPMLRAMTELGAANFPGSIPFVIDRGNGNADCGYSANKWAIDLYRYAVREAPEQQRHRIIGLLLGYSAQAIQEHDELTDSLQTVEFNGSNALRAPATSGRIGGSPNRAGNARQR